MIPLFGLNDFDCIGPNSLVFPQESTLIVKKLNDQSNQQQNTVITTTNEMMIPWRGHVDSRRSRTITMRQAVPLCSSNAMKLLLLQPLLLLLLMLTLDHAAHAQTFSSDVVSNTTTTTTPQPMCVNPVLPVLPQKTVYRVGVLDAHAGDAYAEYSPTFSTYLTHMVGSRFTPPITFETVPVTFDDDGGDVLEQFISAEYDFFYTNPK
jgi:hypothetical protein